MPSSNPRWTTQANTNAAPPPYQALTSGAQQQSYGSTLPTREQRPLLPVHGQVVPQKGTRGWKIWKLLLISLFCGALLGAGIQETLFGGTYSPVRREAIRRSWSMEWNAHMVRQKQMDSESKLWDIEAEYRESFRHSWTLEKAAYELETKIWMSERMERERIREEERQEDERKRKQKQQEEEEDARQRAGLVWGEHNSGQCLKYGTRRHWAKLGHIPDAYDAMKGCSLTPMEIHGRMMLPNECVDKGANDGVWGVWHVDFNEPYCTPYWTDIKDKGCIAQGSGIRRYEAHLENIHWDDDWQEICATTTATFGRTLGNPKACADWGKYGKFGIWEVDSYDCY